MLDTSRETAAQTESAIERMPPLDNARKYKQNREKTDGHLSMSIKQQLSCLSLGSHVVTAETSQSFC